MKNEMTFWLTQFAGRYRNKLYVDLAKMTLLYPN
jgi:hypothetical protein